MPPKSESHELKVERVARALRSHAGDRPIVWKKKSVSHQVPKRRDGHYPVANVDVSDLREVLAIDVEARTCTDPARIFGDLYTKTCRPNGPEAAPT